MGQTLCANLRCDHTMLEELDEAFRGSGMIAWFQGTSDAILSQAPAIFTPDTNTDQCMGITGQVRDHFYKVISGLTTLEPDGTTIAEEWPIALEFNGWASEECIEFCNSYGLIGDLRKCRMALERIFSNLKKSTVELDYYPDVDDDYGNDGRVVIRLEIISDRKTYRNEYHSWVSWLVENLSDKSRMFISVSIDRLQE